MSKLQPYQHRVIAERSDMLFKFTRLAAFIDSALFTGIAPAEQERLRRQASLMDQLLQVLQERIDFFPEVNAMLEESRATSTADVRSALAQEIPLDTIGPIVSTDMHPNMASYDPAQCISFWGKFTYQGLALQEMTRATLREHLLHAIGPQGHTCPAGYIGVVALKAGS